MRLRELAPELVCGRCRARPPAFERLIAAYSYEGPVEAVITGLKYRRLDYLGSHLAGSLAPILGSREPPGGTPGSAVRWDLVVPVPLHWRRRWGRGYNQAERIARPLARHLGLPCRELLRRRRATRPQARLARADRLENPAGAFAVRRRFGFADRLAGRRVLLVDDVATTGATLDAAARALLRAGVSGVTAVAGARTPDHS
jgi:ComF family protein